MEIVGLSPQTYYVVARAYNTEMRLQKLADQMADDAAGYADLGVRINSMQAACKKWQTDQDNMKAALVKIEAEQKEIRAVQNGLLSDLISLEAAFKDLHVLMNTVKSMLLDQTAASNQDTDIASAHKR